MKDFQKKHRNILKRKEDRMRLIKKSIIFSILYLSIFIGTSFAAPGIKITKPLNNSTVTSGQEITVTVEAAGGFKIKQGMISIAGAPNGEDIASLPITFTDKIPAKAFGTIDISAIAKDSLGNVAVDSVTLKVQQTSSLKSLKIYSDGLLFETDWDGNVKNDYYPYIGGVYGVYSDGTERYISKDPNTIYSSSDPSLISIDSTGKMQVHKSGDVKITVSNSEVSLDIPVVFQKPQGIKPSQTVPPTIQINIQPPANFADWYNKDITITITAKANEPDVVQELSYQFTNIDAKPTRVNGSQTVIPFSQEGINLFRYVAYDNELNGSDQQSVTIQLDKTPPSISLSLDPYTIKLPFKCENRYFLLPFFYKLSYSATDKLSGVKSVNGGLAIPNISSYKTQLIKRSSFQIILNEKTQHIIIASSNPQETLTQLKTNKIVPIDNNQVMHLNEREKLNIWTITKIGSYLAISAPSITFEATAQDNADNIATKEIKYARKVIPLPDYVKPLISKKELSSEEIDDLEDDAVIDADTLKTIRKNYGKIP